MKNRVRMKQGNVLSARNKSSRCSNQWSGAQIVDLSCIHFNFLVRLSISGYDEVIMAEFALQ